MCYTKNFKSPLLMKGRTVKRSSTNERRKLGIIKEEKRRLSNPENWPRVKGAQLTGSFYAT